MNAIAALFPGFAASPETSQIAELATKPSFGACYDRDIYYRTHRRQCSSVLADWLCRFRGVLRSALLRECVGICFYSVLSLNSLGEYGS